MQRHKFLGEAAEAPEIKNEWGREHVSARSNPIRIDVPCKQVSDRIRSWPLQILLQTTVVAEAHSRQLVGQRFSSVLVHD